jgi:hypothetical protein
MHRLEAERIVQLVVKIISAGVCLPERLGVITPYSEQKVLIQVKLWIYENLNLCIFPCLGSIDVQHASEYRIS